MRFAAALFLLCATSACAQPAVSAPQEPIAGQRTALIELFTSQGCSSCPPADALMQRLATDPGLVVILRPVTYWDNEGWRDTLARPQNTAFQQAYAQTLHVQVYTPQAVVDGAAAAVGSHEDSVRALAQAARERREATTLTVTRTGANARIVVSNAPTGASVDLIALAPLTRVAIGSGENGGQRIDYVNVVRGEHRLGGVRGASASFDATLDSGATHDATRWAVVVQDGATGAVHATAYVPDL